MNHSSTNRRPTVLVLGGGFGGVETAIELARGGAEVTLISERPHLYLYPTSIWRVTGAHGAQDDLVDLESLARQHGFALVVGKVTRLDAPTHQVWLGEQLLQADRLVIALGAGRANPPGTEHTTTIWGSPEDTLEVHRRVQELLKQGGGRIAMGFGGNPKDGSAVRGGPVFEVLFNLDLYLRRLKVRERFELSFFAPMASPGARMGEGAAKSVATELAKRGIAQHVGRKITGFDAQGVSFEGGEHLAAELVMFVPAGAGHPLLKNAGLPLSEAGFVTVDEQCRVPGVSGVYVVGDSAALEGPDWRAKQGHVTVLMARIAAESLLGELRRQPTQADYREHVDIICVMDTGNGAVLVHRNRQHAWLLPLPWLGHWMKIAWGWWYRLSHRRWLPWRRRPALALPA